MSLQGHLKELVRRHALLDEQIASTYHSLSVHDEDLAQLKKQKLHLKDEILRTQHALTHHVTRVETLSHEAPSTNEAAAFAYANLNQTGGDAITPHRAAAQPSYH
jgi:hypothetical protein